ncbi:Fungal specific transcription factor domain-containing protein isoform 2 [Cladophialophora immunda]|nr:Fungal specific transcription factor domain-containing protein isoform 1 [Cladophialophora immunda]OQV00629.1 Fungal specific transcription factor domain-containing protein isoform 2 [Cladophialophora immunda]
MVGVPGKSKGCSTCRRRKKGCDQKRPVCGQCATTGNICGGYDRERTFILHPASKKVEHAIFVARTRPAILPLPGSVNRGAVESQCKSLFWDLYMPQGDAACRDDFIIRCGHPMNWTEVIQNVTKQDVSLADAFSALSISRVGQGHRDVRLVHESAKLYVKALKELQLALFDPQRMHSDHVLMACMLLGLYEVFEGPAFNSRSWVAHAAGAARLIQLRGARHHQNWLAHHPFLASRIPTIYAAILQRKATYLASEEWRTVPWEFQHRTYFDRMVDLGTLIPGILEKFDILREYDFDTTAELAGLLDECRDLQTKMNKWRDGTKKGAIPRVVEHDPIDQPGYPFATDLWFENHLFAHARLVYHTCSLALSEVGNEILQALYLRDHKRLDSSDRATLKGLFDAESQAANICRCVAYCLQPEMGAWGANIINFPANLAFAYYQKTGHKVATDWLERAFQSAKLRGLHVENVFDVLLPSLRDRDDRMRFAKRESSTESSDSSEHSPASNQSVASHTLSLHSLSSNATTIFVYEDPAKDYDANFEPD